MKLLLIGCGYWGTKLAERFLPLVGGKNLGFYDVEPVRAKEVMERLGDVDTAQLSLHSLDAAIESYGDAVVIATPPNTHYEIAKKCLEAGKHVLVEKPIALKAEHARDLVYLAQKKKVTLMTDDTFLYSPATTVDLVKNMELHWTGPRPASRETPEWGILWELGPHPVSLMLHHMGRYPVAVTGEITPRCASLLYSFTGKHEAVIFMEWDTPGRERYLWWDEDGGCQDIDYDAEHAVEGVDPLANMCRAFVSRVRESDDPETGPWIDYHGLMVVEILEYTEKRLCKSR